MLFCEQRFAHSFLISVFSEEIHDSLFGAASITQLVFGTSRPLGECLSPFQSQLSPASSFQHCVHFSCTVACRVRSLPKNVSSRSRHGTPFNEHTDTLTDHPRSYYEHQQPKGRRVGVDAKGVRSFFSDLSASNPICRSFTHNFSVSVRNSPQNQSAAPALARFCFTFHLAIKAPGICIAEGTEAIRSMGQCRCTLLHARSSRFHCEGPPHLLWVANFDIHAHEIVIFQAKRLSGGSMP